MRPQIPIKNTYVMDELGSIERLQMKKKYSPKESSKVSAARLLDPFSKK